MIIKKVTQTTVVLSFSNLSQNIHNTYWEILYYWSENTGTVDSKLDSLTQRYYRTMTA